MQNTIVDGWERFRMGKFDEAVVVFEAVRAGGAEGNVEFVDATYGLANVWNLRMPMTSQDKKLAEALYQEVIDSNPDHNLASWSSLALARMKHLVPVGRKPDYDAVRKAYKSVWILHPDTQAGEEAFVHLQATYILTMDIGKVQEAANDLEKFIENHPQSGLRYAAWSLLAEAYIIMGKSEELLIAEVETLNAQETDSSNPFAENSWRYWKIAVTAEFEAGDFAIARKYYQMLIDEYPQDIRCYACEAALQRMDALENKIKAEIMGDEVK